MIYAENIWSPQRFELQGVHDKNKIKWHDKQSEENEIDFHYEDEQNIRINVVFKFLFWKDFTLWSDERAQRT